MKFLNVVISILLLCPLHAQIFHLDKVQNKQSTELNQSIKQYESYTINLNDLDAFLQEEIGGEVTFISEDFDVSLQFAPTDILADDFVIKGMYEDGPVYKEYQNHNTYVAYDVENPARAYRFFISEDRIQGKFIADGEPYIIESSSKYDSKMNANEIIVYDQRDFIQDKNISRSCEVIESSDSADEDDKDVSVSQRSSACNEVQLSLAADYLLFESFGSLENVAAELISIINNVEGDYNIQIDDEVNFEINELLVSCCEDCDPWISSTSLFALLSWFKDWGLFDGFERYHDLGILFTDRVTNGGVVGSAYMNSLCGTNKYLAIAHYTNNAESLRMVGSHEIGHAFGCPHNYTTSGDCHPDPGRDPLIMDPVVDPAAIAWATGIEGCVDDDPGDSTVDRINNKLADGGCFDTDCADVGCIEVSNIDVLNVWADHAEVSWVGSAPEYSIKIRKDMSQSYLLDVTTSSSEYMLDGSILDPSTLYVVSIESMCGSVVSTLREAEFVTPAEAIIIPVELVSFEAEQKGKAVELNWETASEVNSDYFSILYSDDGINYTEIETVSSKGTAGSLNNYYSYLHQSPKHGLNYYSLVQYDFDGRFERFETLVVDVKILKEGRLIELVQNNDLGVAFEVEADESVDINLYDTQGNLIQIQSVEETDRIRFDTSNLVTGIYFVQAYSMKRKESFKLFIN